MSNNREYVISSDKTKLQKEIVAEFLLNAGWIKNRESVEKLIDGSLTFGVYHQNQQIGFARVITDYATVAILADVFILEDYRGQGLGKWLVERILAFPTLADLSWLLTTTNAHRLYQGFGFTELKSPERFMQKVGAKA